MVGDQPQGGKIFELNTFFGKHKRNKKSFETNNLFIGGSISKGESFKFENLFV